MFAVAGIVSRRLSNLTQYLTRRQPLYADRRAANPPSGGVLAHRPTLRVHQLQLTLTLLEHSGQRIVILTSVPIRLSGALRILVNIPGIRDLLNRSPSPISKTQPQLAQVNVFPTQSSRCCGQRSPCLMIFGIARPRFLRKLSVLVYRQFICPVGSNLDYSARLAPRASP